MEFLIDDIKVYPQVLESLKDLQAVEVKDNEVYLIRNELDFKSIVFFPPSDLNKKFDFTITTYSSTFSSFMFDEIAKKLNTLDINYPIKNYYENYENSDRYSSFHIDMYGDGELRHKMESLAKKLIVSDYITFHGNIPNHEIRENMI